jgi:hypothetical protein
MAVARLQLREFLILQAHHLHILGRLLAADKPVFANILNIPTKPVWLSIFTLMAASPAVGACYVDGVQNRLANLCALDKIQGATIDVRTLELIDYKLKLEGSFNGLGLPTRVAASTTSKSAYPILSYSDNINGGNSPEPLVLGNLSFDGEKELYRREGILVGGGAGFSGQYIHDEGRYLNYGVSASYAHSSKYGIGVATTSANVSSINHIKNWWYLDVHANTSRMSKDITDDKSSNLTVVTSKVYSSGDNTYNEASFGVNRYFAESYNQNQLVLGYDTIHPNGVFSAVDVTFGESVKNQLASKMSLRAKVIIKLADKPLTVSASYADADGGRLLGFARSDETYSISATYNLWSNLTASVGYRTTNSTIDYFDVNTPTFGVQFSSFEF